jgi:hypothetical protein
MRVQFMTAVILGLTFSPAPVFGCTCAAPPPESKTASELGGGAKAVAQESLTSFVYFPGVTDLSEATAIHVIQGHAPSDLVLDIPAQATFSVSGTVSNSDNPRLPAAIKVKLMNASQPLLAYTVNAARSDSFVFNGAGETWIARGW